MKKQTAVQWILERLPEIKDTSIIETALLIEQQQITMAYGTGLLQFARNPEDIKITEYYDNTYREGKGTN